MDQVLDASLLQLSQTDYIAINLHFGYQQVRSSALELLGSIYHRLGPPLKALLPELRAALQSQVDEKPQQVSFTGQLRTVNLYSSICTYA